MANLNTALTSDNLTHIRAGGFRFRAYLSVVPETTVATARVNQASFDATMAQITVDTTSGWADVEPGMTVKIGTTAGAGDVYVGRVRLTPGASTLYLSEFSEGDPGLNTATTTVALADNQYVTITSSFNLFSVFPRLYYDGTNYTLYKDYSVTYDQQTGSKRPAIVNIGDHVAGFVNSGTNVLTDTRTANVSVFGAETVSSYAWDIGDGTDIGGLTNQSLTATYPPGNRWISCTVTLSNSQTITVRRFIAAHDTGANAPLEVIPTSARKSRANSSVTMELVSTFASALKNNSMAIFWLDASWGGQSVASASTQFVGWVQDLPQTINEVGTVSFTLVNALSILSRTKAFAQRLEYKASPDDWIYSDVMHIDHAVFYVLKFHSTLLELFDFTGTGMTSYTAEAWRVEEGNFIGQVNRLLECVNAEITQVSSGAIYLRRNPAMMGTTARSSVVDRMTITADDVANVDFSYNVRNSVGKVQGNAFSIGTGTPTPYRADGYGTVSGQGTNTVTLNNQRANQAELNERVSNKLALENNPYPSIRLELATGGYDVIEPALWYFTTLNIASSYVPDGAALSFRCIPQEVSISYGENGVQTVSVTVSAETSGLATPGETVEIPVSPIAYDANGLPILDFDSSLGWGLGFENYVGMSLLPAAPVDDSVNEVGIGTWALAWNEDGLARTSQINLGAPDWSLIAGISGDVLSVIRLSSTRALVLTSNNVYDVTALKTTPVVTNRQAVTNGLQLRYAEGVTGNIASGMYLATTAGAGTPTVYTDGFTTSALGAKTFFSDATYPFYKWGIGGVWQSTQGRTDAGCLRATQVLPDGNTEVAIYIDLGEECELTAASMYIKTSQSGKAWGWKSVAYGDDKVQVGAALFNSFDNLSNTSYQSRSWTGTRSGVRYVQLSMDYHLDDGQGYMDDISISYTPPSGGSVTVKYSDDAWVTTESTQTVGTANADEYGYDVDDFDLGIHLAAANERIYHTSTYTGAFSQITGLSVPSGSAKVILVRAIRKVVATQVDNDDDTAFEFVYGTDTAISNKTLFLCTLNATTSAATEVNITPFISSVYYRVVAGDGNQWESYGGNTQRMIGIFQPTGGGAAVILGSVDGGTAWAIKATGFDLQWVRFVEPGLGGDGQKIYAAGADGVFYSPDFGNTWIDKNGDFATATGSAPATGGFKL